jgi:hypothetical protein
MLTTLKTTLIAGLIGLSGLAAVPASAESLYLNFGDRHDSRFGVYMGDDSRTYYPRERWRERRYGRYGMESRCSPGRALDKAERMGIHRARVSFVSPRRIAIAGRQYGERVRVTFARAPGCPVISY